MNYFGTVELLTNRILEMLLLVLVLYVNIIKAEEPVCSLYDTIDAPFLSKDGDIIIAGLFNIHNNENTVYQSVKTMIFAIEEINNNSKLLPNITLGYKMYDACSSVQLSIKKTLAVLNDPGNRTFSNLPCSRAPAPVLAVIGMSSAKYTQAVSTLSFFSSCACLSDRTKYPTLFRTVPNDYYQSRALAQLLKHFGWNWVGTVRTDNDFGNDGVASFSQAAQEEGICIEYSAVVSIVMTRQKYIKVIRLIKESSAKVVVAYLSAVTMKTFIDELVLENATGLQWVGVPAWMTKILPAKEEYYKIMGGAIGMAYTNAVIPGLRDYLLNIHPFWNPEDSYLKELWEVIFSCSFNSKDVTKNKCTGRENLRDIKTEYNDESEFRVPSCVYKALYAVAHALHDLYNCKDGQGPLINKTCADKRKVEPWQVEKLINWQPGDGGLIKFVTVGFYDPSLPDEKKIQMKNVSILYSNDVSFLPFYEVPTYVCTESCLPGTRKAVRRGQHVCCFDCIPCAEGEISNQTNSLQCMSCPISYRSNQEKNQCILKDTEFLSFEEIMGSLLVLFALLGALMTVCVAVIFILYIDTPVVRANNSELSFLLLFSLILCFLCSLTFIGQPSDWSCMLRHTIFGITFALCISCILAKTVVVLMAFRATLPGSNVMKWFGPCQQRMSVASFTLTQVIMCTFWLFLSPPFPHENFMSYKEKIILECEVGSMIAFCVVLGYIGFLSAVCFVLAFLARKLPDNFNEAQLITFSMLIFCSVWITFIPAYISSPGKYTVAVEIFAILASSFGLLFCIFFPKCYVILLKPEQNTRKHIMGKMPSK
uniref:G-protein coupled receptors family 3 profile domain-containing protein n=1 Tax=Erpetoichthys calabaricus TaxID=27687 RepID=A0A8C4TKV7_ERPCA